jgi:hypothetical protein
VCRLLSWYVLVDGEKWCRTVLRGVWLSSDGEKNYVVCIPFFYGGGCRFHYGPVRQVSAMFLVDTFSRCVYVFYVACRLCGGILCNSKGRFCPGAIYTHYKLFDTVSTYTPVEDGVCCVLLTWVHVCLCALFFRNGISSCRKLVFSVGTVTVLHHFFSIHRNILGQHSAHSTSTMCTRLIRLDYRCYMNEIPSSPYIKHNVYLLTLVIVT